MDEAYFSSVSDRKYSDDIQLNFSRIKYYALNVTAVYHDEYTTENPAEYTVNTKNKLQQYMQHVND